MTEPSSATDGEDASVDPATVAAAAPEPQDVADPVRAVGIGPGDPAYLTAAARRTIAAADVVVGFESVVRRIEDVAAGDCLTCGYGDQAETLAAFAGRVKDGERGVAVLMGDPNFSGYQFVGRVERAVDRPVRILPGVSSLQVAAARARTPMESSTFVTLHRRGDLSPALERLRADVGDRHLLVLPHPHDWMPPAIASMLSEAGADPALPAVVFERLTLEGETATRTTLGSLAAAGDDGAVESDFSDLSVLVVRAR